MRNVIPVRRSSRGFTMVELAVAIVVSFVLVLLALPILNGSRGRCCGNRQLKDSTQIRGIHQGLVMWAQNNKDRYPLPSLLDADNNTVNTDAASKDTTSNIMSILIYNGFFGPELCISPAETNAAIRQMMTYAYSNPAAAANPAKTLWDPAFNADFTAPAGGHFSYAHLMPSGERLADWSNTFDANTAVVGNRGPQVSKVTYTPGRLSRSTAPANSNTLLIHGSRITWEGNIAYNDNHVNFETRPEPDQLTFKDSAGVKWGDCLFYDEPEDAAQRNAYLSIWTRSGTTPAEFNSIWD